MIERLVRHGAAPPQPGTDPCQWLREALRTVGSRRIRHPGNHRYALRIGRTRGERTRTAIGLATGRYPKPSGQFCLPSDPGGHSSPTGEQSICCSR